MNVVEFTNVSKKYGKSNAVSKLSFTLAENKITGLIGRNGAGKTTLLKMMAGYVKPSSGNITVFSKDPFDNLQVSANRIFIDHQMSFSPLLTLKELLITAGRFYANWDSELAWRLFDYFSLNPDQNHAQLSKGMKSTFNMIIGLAAHCPLTIFDEPTSGMDAAVRKDFYRALLKDYLNHPRTIILSSHLVSEIEDLLEDILLINDGEKYLHLSVEELREYAVGVSGNASAIKELAQQHSLIHQKDMGSGRMYAVMKTEGAAKQALDQTRKLGLELTPVAVDDLCMHVTSKSQGGIDSVFN
ncbi:ABC-2 type transport system ATP-binding protein [Fictibacillus solisalsi]|uniref:ABC-2 type transport system ATP-binding protein n=1 Tax=Fictibacillus solisalsi TaxID=459525 RepID=A0A1H0A2U7_9BACL|nr:ABC transporter ATP-binding protein [Fictibacillus solisalsi]SDN27293.1 ABC-2 type transport system ATP-binding protein [Fictibacillus solisalsi]